MLRRMSISSRLLSAFSVLAVLILLAGVFSISSLSNVRQRAELLETNIIPTITALNNITKNLLAIKATTNRLALTENINAEGERLNRLKKFRENLLMAEKTYEDLIVNEDERQRFKQFVDIKSKYLEMQLQIVPLLERGDAAVAIRELLDEMRKVELQYDAKLDEIYKLNDEFVQQARAEAISSFNSAKFINVLVILVSLGFAASIAIFIARSINQPLLQAVRSAQAIAAGDLTQKLTTDGQDELTELMKAQQQMQQNLCDAIGHIASASNQLASAAEQLNVVTDESSKALQLQSDEVQQAAAAITEMSSAVDEVANTALKTSEASSQSASLAKDGTLKVVQTSNVIERMNADVRQSAQVIDVLAAKVVSINQVLEVIRSVADQTNLLALNAAIEAARAGEAGRGFAVVADEVRSLAYRTQTSTGEIEQMIQQVQASAKEAVNAMQLISGNAENAQGVAKSAADALELIAENIVAISDQNHIIAGAAEQQSKVAREIDRNIITISDLAAQTSAGASQTTASASELTRLAVRLNELVSKFKV